MRITVIGKAHMQGTSKKTGKPYDFIEIHFNTPARNVEGVAAKTAALDPQLYPYDRINVGEVYVIERDERGWPVEFYPAPAKG